MGFSSVVFLLSALVAGYMSWKFRRNRNKATIGLWLGIGYASIAFGVQNWHGFHFGPFFIFFGTVVLLFDSMNPDNLTVKELRDRGNSARRSGND